MNKRALVAGALSILSVLATACGGDAKSPKIRSFTGTPATLPTLGGETTLTWDVKNADSLELLPDVGAVTGSALTLSVTETTEFTLIARKDGRVDRKKTTVTCVAPGAVEGVVRFTTTRQPVPNVAVFLNGEATVTDETGRFYFEDVATPYDIMMYTTVSPIAIVYQGLTRLDPYLEFPITLGGGSSIIISGTVTPTTAAANTFTTTALKGTRSVMPAIDTADNGTGAYAADVDFTCMSVCPSEDTETVTGIATRYTYTGTGLATFSHLGRTRQNLVPADGDTTGFDIAMTPVSNAVTTGTFEVDDFPWSFIAPVLVLDSATGAASDVGIPLPPQAFSITTAFAFSVASPDVTGELQLWSQYTDLSSGSLGIHVARLAPGDTGVSVAFPPLPKALTPLDNGVVTGATKFRIAASDSSVKMFSVQGGGLNLLLVFTTKDTITLPDLSALGMPFEDGPMQWNVLEIAPAPSTDDVAGPDGIFGAQPEVFGFTTPRDATYESTPTP